MGQASVQEEQGQEETSDEESDDTEDEFMQKAGKNILDTSADMFGSLEPVDREIVQSVLVDLEEGEDEDDNYFPPSNQLRNSDDLF